MWVTKRKRTLVELDGCKKLCPGEALEKHSLDKFHVIPNSLPIISYSPRVDWGEAHTISFPGLDIDFPKQRLVDWRDGAEILKN